MPRKDPPVSPLLGKAFLDSLQLEQKPLTLKAQLRYLDQVVASEENFLNNIDSHLESLSEEVSYVNQKQRTLKGRNEGQPLNFDTTDYRRLSDLNYEDETE